MNKEYFTKPKHNIGDLIGVEDTSLLGLIIDMSSDIWSECGAGSYFYQIHFCEEEVPDQRWLPEDMIQRI